MLGIIKDLPALSVASLSCCSAHYVKALPGVSSRVSKFSLSARCIRTVEVIVLAECTCGSRETCDGPDAGGVTQ